MRGRVPEREEANPIDFRHWLRGDLLLGDEAEREGRDCDGRESDLHIPQQGDTIDPSAEQGLTDTLVDPAQDLRDPQQDLPCGCLVLLDKLPHGRLVPGDQLPGFLDHG